jgi:hypothetical protein
MLFSIIKRVFRRIISISRSIGRICSRKINLDDEAATTGAMTGEGLAPGPWSRPRGLFSVISNLMFWWCGFPDKNAPLIPTFGVSWSRCRMCRLGRVGVLTGTQVGTCSIYQLESSFHAWIVRTCGRSGQELEGLCFVVCVTLTVMERRGVFRTRARVTRCQPNLV